MLKRIKYGSVSMTFLHFSRFVIYVWMIIAPPLRKTSRADLFRVPRMARLRGDGFQPFLFELLLRLIPEVKVVGWPIIITQPPKHFYP